MLFFEKFMQRLRGPIRPLMRIFKYYFCDTSYTIGKSGYLHLGKRVCVANTIFNLSSGSIYIGDFTIFNNNIMALAGRHSFHNGQRASLIPGIRSQIRR